MLQQVRLTAIDELSQHVWMNMEFPGAHRGVPVVIPNSNIVIAFRRTISGRIFDPNAESRACGSFSKISAAGNI
ncbi:hypothetical protein CN934_22575 [Ensifer sp. MMN_5]|nr:hypothetical protein CN934_22575 [Ensifer sp. MMN_5]